MNGVMTGPRATGRVDETWLRPYRQVRNPRLRLVCFPHAGGAASAFRTWPLRLPADIDVLAACYPGRESRLRERVVERMDQLVAPLVAALLPLTDRPLALFGHSMGASVAHEVALRLNEVPGADVCQVFISARQSPRALVEASPINPTTDEELIAEVVKLGQSRPEVFADPDLRDLLLPALRADFKLVADYRPDPVRVLPVPVTAYGGTSDPEVPIEELLSWSAATSAAFEHRLFPGGHFYLERHEADLVPDIGARLKSLPNSVAERAK
ncbi:alpha/beta fold hydrolase [Kitasatospora sp. NBC_00315]